MSTETETPASFARLVQACLANHGEPALRQFLRPEDWSDLAPYLQPVTVSPGQVLITQGAGDRTVYFVESGTLGVHFEDAVGRVRLATVGPGAALGEGSFFSHMPRNATVQASSACAIWALTPARFEELAQAHPARALALTLALGAVVAGRMFDHRRRISVT